MALSSSLFSPRPLPLLTISTQLLYFCHIVFLNTFPCRCSVMEISDAIKYIVYSIYWKSISRAPVAPQASSGWLLPGAVRLPLPRQPLAKPQMSLWSLQRPCHSFWWWLRLLSNSGGSSFSCLRPNVIIHQLPSWLALTILPKSDIKHWQHITTTKPENMEQVELMMMTNDGRRGHEKSKKSCQWMPIF